MYHHDHREYRVAVDDTARRFQAELEAKVSASRTSALQVIERVQREVPDDRIASSHSLHFEAVDGRIIVSGKNVDFEEPLHRHALSQIADRAGVPDLFVSRLLEKPWGPTLLAENLSTILGREPERRMLLRSVGSEVRGVLSDSYRRLDSRPIIEAFAAACQEIGVVPIEGVGGDLRFCIRAILPVVFRPAGEEVVAFGIEISNSDFGAGALSVRCFLLRVWCTNYARLDEELRKIHLGKRLDDSIEYSKETYELDTKAMSSAVRDIVIGSLAPAKVNRQVELIEQSMNQRIDFKSALLGLPKMGLLKKEVEAVRETFNSGGIEQLPPGNTTYRLAHAISWIAKAADSAERRLELEHVAGQLIVPSKANRQEREAV